MTKPSTNPNIQPRPTVKLGPSELLMLGGIAAGVAAGVAGLPQQGAEKIDSIIHGNDAYKVSGPIPGTTAGIEAAAAKTITETKMGNDAHDQLQP